MKFKQILLSAVVSVSLITFSSSAFASDTISTAKALKSNEFYADYITSPDDVDWFRWTNNTGKTVGATVLLFSPYLKNYDLIMAYPSSHGGYDYYVAPDKGAASTDLLRPNVLHGNSIFWKVVPHSSGDFSSNKNYFTWVVTN